MLAHSTPSTHLTGLLVRLRRRRCCLLCDLRVRDDVLLELALSLMLLLLLPVGDFLLRQRRTLGKIIEPEVVRRMRETLGGKAE